MPQNVTPIAPPRKVAAFDSPGTALVFRETMAAHRMSFERLAELWGCSRTLAQLVVNGERGLRWRHLDALPAAFLDDFHRRCGARTERATRSIEGEHLDVVVELGRLTEEIRSAMADGHLDDGERARIRQLAARLAAEVADVQRAVG